MKNKMVKMGALVIAAVTVFTATAFASNSTLNNRGYEELKQILKSSHGTERFSSAAFDGKFQMTDNGKLIAEVSGEVKGNREGKAASGNVQINLMGKGQELSFYKSEDTSYLVDQSKSKYYQLINMDENGHRKHREFSREESNEEQHMGKTGEAFMDYFMGDLKSQFELSESVDGTKSITLDLDQNEIPVPVNLLVGVAAENSHRNKYSEQDTALAQKQLLEEKLPFLKEFSLLEKDMPELKQDVKLTGLFLKLNVDENNQIKSFEVKISITGKDINGAYHEISYSGSAAIKGINNTTVDTFSPDGKTIETIDAKEFKCSEE